MFTLILVLAIGGAPLDEVTAHANAILAAQLDDGAIVTARDGDRIHVGAYHGAQACLALFDAYSMTGDKTFLDAGVKWTDWYLDHMDAEGRPLDYKGAAAAIEPVGLADNADAAMAAYFRCVDLRRYLTGEKRFYIREHPRLLKIFASLEDAIARDGLTQSAGPGSPRLLANNAEVYLGIAHARRLAEFLRDYEWLEDCYYARYNMSKAIETLRGGDGLYPWLCGAEADAPAAPQPYPDGAANMTLAALGPLKFHEAKRTVKEVNSRFPDLAGFDVEDLYWTVRAARRAHQHKLMRDALETMAAKISSGGPVTDHAYYLMALGTVHRLDNLPKKPSRWPASTFIGTPLPAVR